MNLSPRWVAVLQEHGWDAVHWSAVGDVGAPDRVLLEWARANHHVLFTHDLDFGAILATSGADGPSVIQFRTQDVLPESLANRLMLIMQEHSGLLEKGALIVVDEKRSRVRILPLSR